MRKEAKKRQNVNTSYVQGYHQGGHGSETYAFAGFEGNWYFNSDRKIELDGNYQRTDGQSLKGYGLEIETECYGILSDKAYATVLDNVILAGFKFGKSMFKLQSDCTLHGRSNAEIITQIMTRERIRNDYSAYKAMWEEHFRTFDVRTDSAITGCGMHVNISLGCFGSKKETQDLAIRKLFYIVNRHYDVCKKLFYRAGCTDWCGQMNYSVAKTMDLNNMSPSHGNCMNYSHYGAGRIEIRLVGGQKDYFCFRNTMESIFHLVDRVQEISWADCDDLFKVFEGCNNYVMKRLPDCGLSADLLERIRETVKTVDYEITH